MDPQRELDGMLYICFVYTVRRVFQFTILTGDWRPKRHHQILAAQHEQRKGFPGSQGGIRPFAAFTFILLYHCSHF